MSLRTFFRANAAGRPPCGRSRKLQACAAFCLILLSFLAHPDARAQENTPSTLEVSFPNYSYPNPLASLHQLDLKNTEVIFFGEKGVQDFHAHLHRGSYEKLHKIGGDSVEFEWMKYMETASTEPDYAVAYYVWSMWAGSSSAFGVVQLLHIEDGRLKVVQQILFNLRGSESAGAFYNAKSKVLTIRGVNDWEHCCPTGLDVVKFQLKDGALKQVHYGKAPLR
jgi:hypothetical protein